MLMWNGTVYKHYNEMFKDIIKHYDSIDSFNYLFTNKYKKDNKMSFDLNWYNEFFKDCKALIAKGGIIMFEKDKLYKRTKKTKACQENIEYYKCMYANDSQALLEGYNDEDTHVSTGMVSQNSKYFEEYTKPDGALYSFNIGFTYKNKNNGKVYLILGVRKDGKYIALSNKSEIATIDKNLRYEFKVTSPTQNLKTAVYMYGGFLVDTQSFIDDCINESI